MAEKYPSDADLNALSGTTGDSGLPHMTIGESPYYTNEYKKANWFDRLLYATGNALRVFKDAALTFGVSPGRFLDGDTVRDYAGAAAQALTDNQTNYIYLTAAGTLTVNTTGFPTPSATPHVPLATILTASGDYDCLTDITDYRGRSIFTIAAGLSPALAAEAAAFFGATDISGAEAETLTDLSNADSLHTHGTSGIDANAVTNAKLNADVAGDGIQGGAGSALAVDVSDFAGEGTEDDGSENLRAKLDGSTLARSASGLKVADGGIADTQIDAAAAIARSKLAEEELARYQVSLMADCRQKDGVVLDKTHPPISSEFIIRDSAGGACDWSDGTLILEGADSDDGDQTSTLCFEFCPVPPEYVAGHDVKLIISARYAPSGGVIPAARTIDAQVYELTDSGANGGDLCTTGIQTITDAYADYEFLITHAGFAPGDRLMVYVQMFLTATVATYNAQIGSIEMQLDIKG